LRQPSTCHEEAIMHDAPRDTTLRRSRSGRPGHSLPATQGQALIFFALLLPVLAGFTGLALDTGSLYFQRRALQSIADSAALTGAQVANFNVNTPAILPDGVVQARQNAIANGAANAEITVNWPPSAGSGPWAGRVDYIEVIVERTVPNAFMALFGQRTSTLHARAVARCIKVGFGAPAVLALSDDPDAITFNGGSSSAVNIVGDVISHGGINPNGNAEHFQIEGAAYALTQPAPDNLTTTNGIFGSDDNLGYLDVPDPVAQAQSAVPPAVVWPDFATLSNGTAEVCRTTGSGTTCNNRTGNVTVGSGDTATFSPGQYGNVTIRGDAVFEPGVYSFNTLDLTGGGTATDHGDGVLLHVRGAAGITVDASGGVEFTFTAIQPNTWMDIVLYVEHGDMDLTGNGVRELNGSVYAPEGEVAISGSGGDAIVNGQVIADTVRFSGNGPTVNYPYAGNRPSFGPILVNTP
jgi:hypothetical protein